MAWMVVFLTAEPDAELRYCVGPFDSQELAEAVARNGDPVKRERGGHWLYGETIAVTPPAEFG